MMLTAKKDNAQPLYLFKANPALAGYYPKWVDNLAEDATLEGSMLDGIVRGDDVKKVVLAIRSLYDRQAHRFAGAYGDNNFLEDYVAEVRGRPIGCVVLVYRNGSGQTQHVTASYRPRSSVVFFAKLLAEKFAGTTIAQHFAESER
jgi:hypothetical protein